MCRRKSSTMLNALVVFLVATPAEAQEPIPELLVARQAIDATGFNGAMLIYDSRQNRYQAGHAERIDRQLVPASTFKIFNSLVALETGVVAGAETVIRWDGIVR